jgi:hypothetical protein
MNRRKFVKKGALFVPAIFVPKLIRASAFTDNVRQYLAAREMSGIKYYTTGLLAWWRFLEGAGTIANDSSGNSEAGTLINGGTGLPIWGTGPTAAGGSLTFNGSNNYVDTENFADNPTNLSVCAWFKTTQDVYSQSPRNEYVVISKLGDGAGAGTGTIDEGTGWYIAQSGDVVDNAIMVGMQNGNGSAYWQISSPTACNNGVWNHVVLLISAAGGENGNITMYYNGVNVGNGQNQQDGSNPYGSISNTSNVRIAQDYGTYYGNPQIWTGPIADVRIYSGVLSSTIIGEIYAGTA